MNFLFWSFEFRVFEFVSDFDFRHSDLKCKTLKTPPSRGLPDASRYAGGALTYAGPRITGQAGGKNIVEY